MHNIIMIRHVVLREHSSIAYGPDNYDVFWESTIDNPVAKWVFS